jgi:hypothetical protein
MYETSGGLSSLLKKKMNEIRNKCCFTQIPSEKIKVILNLQTSLLSC